MSKNLAEMQKQAMEAGTDMFVKQAMQQMQQDKQEQSTDVDDQQEWIRNPQTLDNFWIFKRLVKDRYDIIFYLSYLGFSIF